MKECDGCALDQTGGGLGQALEEAKAFALGGPWTPPTYPQSGRTAQWAPMHMEHQSCERRMNSQWLFQDSFINEQRKLWAQGASCLLFPPHLRFDCEPTTISYKYSSLIEPFFGALHVRQRGTDFPLSWDEVAPWRQRDLLPVADLW